MLDIFISILLECWQILLESAPYVLFGFFATGLLKALVPQEAVVKHLGKSSAGSVLKASVFGVPLPLCSCAVIPAAIGLRKQGASRGASAAFMVSVPETGVDSVAITWALLDPVLTVVRPAAALITATITGLLINLLPEESALPETVEKTSCGSSCCAGDDKSTTRQPLLRRLRAGQVFAFGELLADIGKWLLFGIVLAGVISFLVPDDFMTRYMGSEFLSLLIMLGVGIPIYICASASTPIAAVLILKGLSPGAALVFLLAGPATNAATLTVVYRFFGRAATGIYLASIAVCSLAFGFLINRFYALAGIDIIAWVKPLDVSTSSPFAVASAVILLILIGKNFLPGANSSSCGCDDSCSS